jgi:hypothetical protein
MLQDLQFTNDVKVLIQEKQKQSAFVYVRNHLELIEEALHQGAKISDIHNLLQKNGINLTLPTLRLYLHRLRNLDKKLQKKILIAQNEASFSPQSNNTSANPLHNNLHVIKQQTPDLEQLSKAFIQRKL